MIAWSRNRSRQHNALHQTSTGDGMSSSTKASQMRVANHTSATDSCRTSLSRKISKGKLFTPTDDVLRHFMWCERKSVRTCLNGNRYWTNLQTQTHSSAQHTQNKSNAKIQGQQNANLTDTREEASLPRRNMETQMSDARARVCRSAT